MAGTVGWLGPAEVATARDARLDRATRPGARDLAAHRTDDAVVACTSPAGSVHADDRLLVAIGGAFHWTDAAARAQAAEQGAARAFARLFRERGAAALDALGGAFGVAVVDRSARRAFLAVDRMGVEPLHWCRDGERVLFASSLATLLAALPAAPAVEPQAVYDYLFFSFVPSPATGWVGCRALRPAQHVTVGPDADVAATYWRPDFRERGAAASATAAELRDVVRASVARSLPRGRCGAFLSGGLDSSTMVGMMARLAGPGVPAFSLGYDIGVNGELPYARATARFYGAEHHECVIDGAQLAAAAAEIAGAFASPFGNVSAAALLPLLRDAASCGVATLVAGDGGDELFAGNRHYELHRVLGLWDRVPRALRRGVLEPLAARLPFGARVRAVRRVRGYVRRASLPMPERLRNYNALEEAGVDRVLSPAFLEIVDREGPIDVLRRIHDAAPAASPLNRMLAVDWETVLHGSDVPRVLVGGALAGVDIVFPLLADDVVELSTRIPVREKMTRRRLRAFYVDAFRDFLPPETVRKPKQGEGVPFGAWAARRGELRDFVRDTLSAARRRGVVHPAYVDRALAAGDGGDPAEPLGTFAYRVVMLEEWFRRHVDATGRG